MSWIPLLFYGAIGIVLAHNHGNYSDAGILVVISGWIGTVAAGRAKPLKTGGHLVEIFLWALIVYFGYRLLNDDILQLIDSKSSHTVVKAFLWVSFVFSLGGLLSRARLSEKAQTLLCVLIGAALFGAKIFALMTSRHPHIDVFTISSAGADYLRHGINPYAQSYPDIYHGAYGYTPTYCYWPGVLLPETVGKWIFGDIRSVFILADAATAFGLVWLARAFHWPKRLSVLIPLLWLSFPVTLFVLDQAWVDTLLIACAVLFALLAFREKWILAGIALGVFCTVKQYSVFFGWLSLLFVFASTKRTSALIKTTLAAFLSFCALMLPWMIWNWQAFYQGTIAEFLKMPARNDALSIPAALKTVWGWNFPPIASVMIYFMGALAASIFFWRRCEEKKNAFLAWSVSLVLIYGVTFLFGKQAFCNYYYFMAFLVLLQALFSYRSEELR